MKHGSGEEASPAEELSEQALALGVQLSPESASAILGYEDLLRELADRVGGISRADVSSPERLRVRHILDCLRAVGTVLPTDREAYDLGSGVGLPGIVVAAACPFLRVHLIEARRRRVALLELAVERLALRNAHAVAGRAQDLAIPVDVCFARALAPAGQAWAMAEPRLLPGGRLVYFAGSGERSGGPTGAPPGASGVRVIPPPGPLLESAGPLVIMARE